MKQVLENFSKKDLSTGNVIICRNGLRYIVMLNAKQHLHDYDDCYVFDVLIRENGFLRLDEFNQQLLFIGDHEDSDDEDDTFKPNGFDIMEVHRLAYPNIIKGVISKDTLLWKRRDLKTLKQIQNLEEQKLHLKNHYDFQMNLIDKQIQQLDCTIDYNKML